MTQYEALRVERLNIVTTASGTVLSEVCNRLLTITAEFVDLETALIGEKAASQRAGRTREFEADAGLKIIGIIRSVSDTQLILLGIYHLVRDSGIPRGSFCESSRRIYETELLISKLFVRLLKFGHFIYSVDPSDFHTDRLTSLLYELKEEVAELSLLLEYIQDRD